MPSIRPESWPMSTRKSSHSTNVIGTALSRRAMSFRARTEFSGDRYVECCVVPWPHVGCMRTGAQEAALCSFRSRSEGGSGRSASALSRMTLRCSFAPSGSKKQTSSAVPLPSRSSVCVMIGRPDSSTTANAVPRPPLTGTTTASVSSTSAGFRTQTSRACVHFVFETACR